MKVIFVHHSCFVVEMEDVVLIFDYFEGNRVTGYTLPECFRYLTKTNPFISLQAISIRTTLI